MERVERAIKEATQPDPPFKLINAVAFSHDGKMLAVGGFPDTLTLWNVRDGQPIGLHGELIGHKTSVQSVTFNPDGTRLASGSDDGVVILWDIASKKPLVELRGHTQGIRGLAFTPDGRKLVSGSEDGTNMVWDIDIESLHALACRIANRNLSRNESIMPWVT